MIFEEYNLYDLGFDDGYTKGYQKAIDTLKATKNDYKNGHIEGFNKGYKQGLNTAWECLKKIFYIEEDGGINFEKLEEIFDIDPYISDYRIPAIIYIIKHYSIEEIVKRINKYEENKDKLNVGDEIITTDLNEKGIIVKDDGRFIYYCGKVETMGAGIGKVKREYCKKTGKSYPEFIKILNQLNEDKGE